VKTRRIVAICLLLAGGVALLALERRLVTTEISPRPLAFLIADTEREVERIPLQLTRVSDQEENQIGQELARSYGLMPAVHKEPDDQRIAQYVERVGQHLAAGVKRKGIQYRFYYKEDANFVNAGALPGGQIVIGRGLLELLETEDELAAILGHEIAHVDERHAIERLQYEIKSRKIGMRGLYRLAQFGVMLFQMGYTKEKEDEADRVGLGIAVRAGYSPAGAVEVMKRFDRLYGGQERVATSPVEELAGMPLRSLREYFRSHPPARERIATLEKEIQARGFNVLQVQKPLAVRMIFLAEQAEVLDKHGVFDRAIARYQEALKADPNYDNAWAGLARTEWRKGDAEAAARDAAEAIARRPEWPAIWKLLAEALAVSSRADAAEKLRKLQNQHAAKLMDLSTRQIESDRNGLAILAGHPQAMEKYAVSLARGLSPAFDAEHRRRVAWWMWRAGKHQEALKELEAARQEFPQATNVNLELAWVLSDLGRQADATEILMQIPASGGVMATPEGMAMNFRGVVFGTGEREAIGAVLGWRTDQRDTARTDFQHAADADPVWMVAKWVENNYSAEAAAIIEKLQAEETARRKKEEAKRNAAQKR
jgi:predicted Zn-dependent protease